MSLEARDKPAAVSSCSDGFTSDPNMLRVCLLLRISYILLTSYSRVSMTCEADADVLIEAFRRGRLTAVPHYSTPIQRQPLVKDGNVIIYRGDVYRDGADWSSNTPAVMRVRSLLTWGLGNRIRGAFAVTKHGKKDLIKYSIGFDFNGTSARLVAYGRRNSRFPPASSFHPDNVPTPQLQSTFAIPNTSVTGPSAGLITPSFGVAIKEDHLTADHPRGASRRSSGLRSAQRPSPTLPTSIVIHDSRTDAPPHSSYTDLRSHGDHAVRADCHLNSDRVVGSNDQSLAKSSVDNGSQTTVVSPPLSRPVTRLTTSSISVPTISSQPFLDEKDDVGTACLEVEPPPSVELIVGNARGMNPYSNPSCADRVIPTVHDTRTRSTLPHWVGDDRPTIQLSGPTCATSASVMISQEHYAAAELLLLFKQTSAADSSSVYRDIGRPVDSGDPFRDNKQSEGDNTSSVTLSPPR
jgi:hypothetical protein